jgi:hypothetical protein
VVDEDGDKFSGVAPSLGAAFVVVGSPGQSAGRASKVFNEDSFFASFGCESGLSTAFRKRPG